MKGRLFLFIGLLFAMLSDVNAATTVDDGAFGSIWDALVAWMQGSLGYTIALLGVLGVLLVGILDTTFVGGHLTVKFYGLMLLVPLFVGGAVGMVETMAGLGRGTFG